MGTLGPACPTGWMDESFTQPFITSLPCAVICLAEEYWDELDVV